MRRILVVDDDQSAREIYITALHHDAYEAVGVASGRDAIRFILNEKRPDGMFLDLKLGEMTGLDVLELLRARHLFVPTIVMTAFRLQFDPDRAIELGAIGYVDQPLSIESLQALADRLTRPVTARDDPELLHSRVLAGDPGALECICAIFLRRLPPRLERTYRQLPWDFAVDAVSSASLEYAAGGAQRYDRARLPSVLDFVYLIARRNLLNAIRAEAAHHRRNMRFASEQPTLVNANVYSGSELEIWTTIAQVTKTSAEGRAARVWLTGGNSQSIGAALGCTNKADASRAAKQFKDRLIKRLSRYIRQKEHS